MNLSKMSAYSNYSMFSNESNESLNTASNTEEKSCHTVTDSVDSTSTSSPLSPSSIKLNFSMKKSQSMMSSSSSSKDSSIGSVIARDKSLQSFTQALIHAEPGPNGVNKSVEEDIYETVDHPEISSSHHHSKSKDSIELIDLNPAKKSDSSYTFQSYDCSSRSSTLSSTTHPVGSRPIMGTRVLPPRNNRVADIELDSSTGGGNSSSGKFEIYTLLFRAKTI